MYEKKLCFKFHFWLRSVDCPKGKWFQKQS